MYVCFIIWSLARVNYFNSVVVFVYYSCNRLYTIYMYIYLFIYKCYFNSTLNVYIYIYVCIYIYI